MSAWKGGGSRLLMEVATLLEPRIISCVAGAYPGERAHALDVMTARDVIRITRSRACIIHIPRSPDKVPYSCIPMADFLAIFSPSTDIVPLINTSRAASSDEAIRMIYSGLRLLEEEAAFGYSALIKLEVLDDNLAIVADEVLKCVEALPEMLRERCIPYLPPDPRLVNAACELGCPAVRIASGQIGHRTGILNPSAVRAAVEAASGVPTILEGGLDSESDIEMSARIGAEAVSVSYTHLTLPTNREV